MHGKYAVNGLVFGRSGETRVEKRRDHGPPEYGQRHEIAGQAMWKFGKLGKLGMEKFVKLRKFGKSYKFWMF